MKRLYTRIGRIAAFTLLFLAIGLFGVAPANANTPQPAPTPNNIAIAPILSGCLVSGPAALVCGGVTVAAVLCYMYCQDVFDALYGGGSMMAEHTKNARGSTKDKHQKGDARRQRDQKRKEERRRRGR